MGSTNGLLYKDLHSRVKPAEDEEWSGLDGTKEKKWFSERMKASDYDSLYALFTPGPHQDLWDGIKWTDKDSFSTKGLHARAIAYMDALRRDLNMLYGETEISSLAMQKQAVGRWLSQSDEINDFLTPRTKPEAKA